MTILLIIIAIICLIAGAAGTVFPALPGLPLMFAGTWLLAYAQHYQIISSNRLWFIFFCAAIGTAADFFAGTLGAKYTGASKQAIWGSFLGGIAGIPFHLLGIILGPLLGAAIGELIAKRNLLLAGKVGMSTLIGFIIGTVAKIGAALSILIILLFSYLTH